jgi:Tfp pilus assembly protein PilF
VTLVQVLADETSIHMACDFRLTNPYTKKVVQHDAHKLVAVNTLSVSALVGVTGVAILDAIPVGRWIAERVARPGSMSGVKDILDALGQAEAPLSQIADRRVARHTFVVAAMVGSQSLVTLVSNFEVLSKGQVHRAATARSYLTISSIKPKRARLFLTGAWKAVTDKERADLELSLRAGVSDEHIQEQLSRVNTAASGRTDTVSAGCHVGSLHATGTGASRAFLTDEQKGDFIPPEISELLKVAGLRITPQLDPHGNATPIRVVGSTVVRAEASPEYFREQFKLRPDSAELWNNYGSYLISRRKFDEAIAAFERALALNPTYVVSIANLAKQLWLRKGDVARADRLYADAVALTEPSVPTWILSDYAAFCDEGMSAPDRAGEIHERAAQDEAFPLAMARRGLFLLNHGGDSELANALLAQALAKQPNDAQILILAGQADWFHNGHREAALAKLQKACISDPEEVNALRLAADFSLVLGDPTTTIYYYRKAIRRGASGPTVDGNYGLALLMDRKPSGAFRQLSRAARSAPDDLAIQANLAAALWALRRHEEAVALMRKILELTPPPHIELEVIAMLRIAVPSSATNTAQRLRSLIAGGARADGSTVRTMARDSRRAERDVAYRLADVIEGRLALPAEY